MFPCLRAEDYWPVTGHVGFLRAPLGVVRRTVAPWADKKHARAEFDDLDAAFSSCAPYLFRGRQAMFAVSAGNGTWTVVLDPGYPAGDIVGGFRDRAVRELACEFIGIEWMPAAGRVTPGASFVHCVPSAERRLFRRKPDDERWLRVRAGDTGWEFEASGAARPFERVEGYASEPVGERLRPDVMAGYLRELGIGVDDPDWMDGPAVVASRHATGDTRVWWRTIPELRVLCGYDPAGIPATLA